ARLGGSARRFMERMLASDGGAAVTSSARDTRSQAVHRRDNASVPSPEQQRARRLRDRPAAPVPAEPRSGISVYAASEQFRDEWILLRVTGKDEESNLAVGEVLEHTANRRKITRA